ncbi:metallophosphoesterase [Thermovibrio ammonificans]|uniref:Metallophosphoesterase n=1 Tax=Thermovibrio ammonificans (strain DSM 15698 / JCM 12110 / HB-1) TaxID=648996 RepID=E8T2M4_THEA1|nr:metallophosphoesterase [Thermovibrio ammonificans]ADU97119.1 metallophosphoesterase [Thermovibrio ammonificans HB-1]
MFYFISDTHFFHRNILKLCPLKRREGFEELILSNLERVLREGDTLFVLGDFLWREVEGFKERWRSLPGRKVLICGNHDWPLGEKLSDYFDEIYDFSLALEIKGKRLLLCHFPSKDLRTYRYCELQARITREFRSTGASLLIHGHVHFNPYGVFCGCHLNRVKCVNVNVEFTNYLPVSQEELPL